MDISESLALSFNIIRQNNEVLVVYIISTQTFGFEPHKNVPCRPMSICCSKLMFTKLPLIIMWPTAKPILSACLDNSLQDKELSATIPMFLCLSLDGAYSYNRRERAHSCGYWQSCQRILNYDILLRHISLFESTVAW